VVVRYTKLEHPGGVYIYRVHKAKLDSLCTDDIIKLKEYLDVVFDTCPDTYFHSGPRGSSLKFSTTHSTLDLRGHRVCDFAKNGLTINKERFKSNHSKVQLFMLENDQNTIAIEVPIWLHAEELKGYQTLFKSDEPLTGHIDVLSIEDGKIWVWDYKPNAHREKYANTQVYFYTLMLSQRTGIPLEKFMCGYFDADRAYMFKPEPIKHKNMDCETLTPHLTLVEDHP